jgi:hypothetical protein
MRTLFGRRVMRALLLTVSFCLAFAGFPLHAQTDSSHSRKYVPPPPTAAVKVTVLRSTNGKPIANAAVIFHPIRNGKDEGALELKSDPDGVVKIDVIPIGDTIRLQIIADGWKTYGEDYNIDTDTKEIVVKMKRPTAQYSIYGDGNDGANTSTTTPESRSSSAAPSSQTPLPQ